MDNTEPIQPSTDTTQPTSESVEYSFNQISEMLFRAFRTIAPEVTPGDYMSANDWWVKDTYHDRAIVKWVDGKLYAVGYELMPDGNTVLAEQAAWVEVKETIVPVAKEHVGYIAKAADDEPLVFVAGGAFCDRDAEWVSGDFLSKIAKAIEDKRVNMTVDVWHVGFPSRSNPKPTEQPLVIGHIEKASFENDHLALLPVFTDPADEAVVRANAGDIGLSIYFSGAVKDTDGAFRGDPSGALSVAIMPRGFEAYPYTAVN